MGSFRQCQWNKIKRGSQTDSGDHHADSTLMSYPVRRNEGVDDGERDACDRDPSRWAHIEVL